MRTRQKNTTKFGDLYTGNTKVGTTYYRIPITKPWTKLSDQYINWTSFATYPWTDELCIDELHSGPPYTDGGPLGIEKYHGYESPYSSFTSIVNTDAPYYPEQFRYDGCFYITPVKLPSGWNSISGLPELSTYGAEAYASLKPIKPGADLAIFLGELKDLPRMLRSTHAFFRDMWKRLGGWKTGWGPKQVADHFLNYQFGWLPFLHDLRKFHETYVNLDKMLAQIKRDNGQWVKRARVIDESSVEAVVGSSSTLPCMGPTLLSYFYTNSFQQGSYTITSKSTTRVWAEGRFRYWIPEIDTPLWRAKATAYLFGLFPNPSVLWELTPYSWLVDWFVNIGDVFKNLDYDLAENLASRYAYLMRTANKVIEIDTTQTFCSGDVRMQLKTDVSDKSRIEASPFGFGLTTGDFTVRQWAILSALGISKWFRT